MKYLKSLSFIFNGCFILGFLTMPLLWCLCRKPLIVILILPVLSSFIFIGVFFLSLVFHELTHLIVFLLNGYQNEVLIILFLVFYKKNQKWRLKVDFKLLLLGGGIVFPNLGSIEDEAAFSRARKAVERSLLAAPLFTLISSTTFIYTFLYDFYRNGFLVPSASMDCLSELFSLTFPRRSTSDVCDFKA